MEPELNRQDEDSEEERAVKPAEILIFIVGSARRHRRLALITALSIAVIGILVGFVLPSKYESDSRILVVKSALITGALSNPNHPVVNVDPLAGSTELLMQKANLLAMAREAKLLERWELTRPMMLRLKDRVVGSLFGAMSEADRQDAIVKLLEASMQIWHDETIMQIRASWRDPDSAWTLAKLAQTSFLESRRQQELSVITTAISVIEDEVKIAADAIDPALEEVIRAREQRAARAQQSRRAAIASTAERTVVRTVRPQGATGTAEPNPKLTARLAELRQQIRDVESPWQRRLAELKFQLSDMRGTYGPEHPSVLQQQARINEASSPPAELISLRREEKKLLADIESAAVAPERVASSATVTSVPGSGDLGLAGDSSLGAPLTPLSLTGALLAAQEREEDPMVAAAQAKLTSALHKYDDVTKRLDTARVELATAQAAFQYRYVVVTEPERPRRPVKSMKGRVMGGAFLVAALIGLLAGAARDLLSGRIIEPWQVRTLGVPLLGQVDLNRKRLP